MKDFNNLCELIAFQASNFKNLRALNFKEKGELLSFSNQDFLEKILQFACGIRELGFAPRQNFVNYSYQNPIWLIVDFGIIMAGGVSVPIFQNISTENLLFEIEDSRANFIFTDNQNCLEIIGSVSNNLQIITRNSAAQNYQNHFDFNQILDLGKKALEARKYSLEGFLKDLSPDNLATIIYTSGSTATPKGVELTHRNLVSQIKDCRQFFPLNAEDVVMSFLPLAHIFERMVMMYYLSSGVCVHFADDVKNVGSLLREIKPHLLTTVPRVLEKVYANIRHNIESANFVKKFLGKLALNRAFARNPEILQNHSMLDKIFDFLIYRKFRQALGGNIKMIICGGSALSVQLEKFFWNVGIKVYCGYGLTEASPVLAANCPKFYKLGTVGKAFPAVELKIATDGELLARGENIMRNYHNQDVRSSETFIDDWLRTGDEAQIDEAGFVRIVGRKREIVKNSYGKFINPVLIEQYLTQEFSFLQAALVVGEAKNYTAALLFLDFENLAKFKKIFFQNDEKELQNHNSRANSVIEIGEIGDKTIQILDRQTPNQQNSTNKKQFQPLQTESRSNVLDQKNAEYENQNLDFLNDPKLITFIAAAVRRINDKLNHWEQLKKVKIITQPISIQSGEITPSMKLKRKIVEQKFSSEIEELYS